MVKEIIPSKYTPVEKPKKTKLPPKGDAKTTVDQGENSPQRTGDWRTDIHSFASEIERIANQSTKKTVQAALTKAFPSGTKVQWIVKLTATPRPATAREGFALVWVDLPLSGNRILGCLVKANSRRLGVLASTDLRGSIRGLKKGDKVVITTTLRANMSMGGIPPVTAAFWDGRGTGTVSIMISLSPLYTIRKARANEVVKKNTTTRPNEPSGTLWKPIPDSIPPESKEAWDIIRKRRKQYQEIAENLAVYKEALSTYTDKKKKAAIANHIKRLTGAMEKLRRYLEKQEAVLRRKP